MATSETGQSGGSILGQQGGSIAFNTQLGRSQSYYFREPGYLIDMFSIRPVYYWQGIRPDYLRYQGADYFNPVYNDIGYQDVGYTQFRELYAELQQLRSILLFSVNLVLMSSVRVTTRR